MRTKCDRCDNMASYVDELKSKTDKLVETLKEAAPFVGHGEIYFKIQKAIAEFKGDEKCLWCKREVKPPHKLCAHDYCAKCGCKEYCWLD